MLRWGHGHMGPTSELLRRRWWSPNRWTSHSRWGWWRPHRRRWIHVWRWRHASVLLHWRRNPRLTLPRWWRHLHLHRLINVLWRLCKCWHWRRRNAAVYKGSRCHWGGNRTILLRNSRRSTRKHRVGPTSMDSRITCSQNSFCSLDIQAQLHLKHIKYVFICIQ